MSVFEINAADSFFESVRKFGEDGCWVWTGRPYVLLSIDGRVERFTLARAAWLIYHKEHPPSHQIRRTCLNDRCVRPDHLYCPQGRPKASVTSKQPAAILQLTAPRAPVYPIGCQNCGRPKTTKSPLCKACIPPGHKNCVGCGQIRPDSDFLLIPTPYFGENEKRHYGRCKECRRYQHRVYQQRYRNSKKGVK
jgi:hypothetical protein